MGLFGGITRTLFGGSKQTSKNKFADQINTQFSPYVSGGTGAFGRAASILGGGPEGNQALQDYYDNSGGNFLLHQGENNVDAFMRARGLGQSGAEMKALENYRSGLVSTKLSDYIGQLLGLSGQGLQAGGLIEGAGQVSKGTSSKGMGSFIGALLASDPRLKTDIVPVGKLGVYEFRYKDDPTGAVYRGLMADEVAHVLPEAAGPRVEGFQTIDLAKLRHRL